MEHTPNPTIYNVWQKVVHLDEFNLTLKGFSQAAIQTGFYIPELRIMFDAGVRTCFQPKFILVTHIHTDHIFSLPLILTRMYSNPKVCVPIESMEIVSRFLKAADDLSPDSISSHKLIGVCVLHTIPISSNYFVKVFNMTHDCPCRGYGLYQRKSKLKKEYTNMTPSELLKLKKNNIEISQEIIVLVLAYITDTFIDVFNKHPEILNFKYIMIECTFLNEKQNAHRNHISWNELKPYVIQHKNIKFILFHFSNVYTLEDYLKIIQQDIGLEREIVITPSSHIYIK